MTTRTINNWRAIEARNDAQTEIARITSERNELLVALVMAERALRKHDRAAARDAAKVIAQLLHPADVKSDALSPRARALSAPAPAPIHAPAARPSDRLSARARPPWRDRRRRTDLQSTGWY